MTIQTKEQARQWAKDYVEWASNTNLSYMEIFYIQAKLEKLAKKFNLIKEFKENGLI
jgi:hypothetical protein